MQPNLMLPDQGDLLLRWDDHLVREQREKKKGSRTGAVREVEEKPGRVESHGQRGYGNRVAKDDQ